MDGRKILEEIYRSEEIYRPPLEARSALLPLTRGCSWGRCKFCYFASERFSAIDADDFERRAARLADIHDGRTRMHLTGDDPFCLPTQILAARFETVRRYMPSITAFSMYARADELLRRTDAEMEDLIALGLRALHIGVESGSARVLAMHDKGETPEEIEAAILRARSFGLECHATIIGGLGGRGLSLEHAAQTAALINRAAPVSVWSIGLKVWPNTPLEAMARRGEFAQMSYGEILIEEREMIEAIDITMPCLFVDSTAMGRCTIMATLPDQRDWALAKIDELLAEGEGEIVEG